MPFKKFFNTKFKPKWWEIVLPGFTMYIAHRLGLSSNFFMLIAFSTLFTIRIIRFITNSID